jgi:hypothetical protein
MSATYAVHLADLSALGKWHPIAWMLQRFLLPEIVSFGTKFSDVLVLVDPEADAEAWSAAMGIVNMGAGVRIYEKKDSWQRVAGGPFEIERQGGLGRDAPMFAKVEVVA